jgi:hypothetical protein
MFSSPADRVSSTLLHGREEDTLCALPVAVPKSRCGLAAPMGRTSSWTPDVDRWEQHGVSMTFLRHECPGCPVCTRGTRSAVDASLRLALTARPEIDGISAQGVRAADMRHARSPGLQKVHLRHRPGRAVPAAPRLPRRHEGRCFAPFANGSRQRARRTLCPVDSANERKKEYSGGADSVMVLAQQKKASRSVASPPGKRSRWGYRRCGSCRVVTVRLYGASCRI